MALLHMGLISVWQLTLEFLWKSVEIIGMCHEGRALIIPYERANADLDD
jgi:hypothetical protein